VPGGIGDAKGGLGTRGKNCVGGYGGGRLRKVSGRAVNGRYEPRENRGALDSLKGIVAGEKGKGGRSALLAGGLNGRNGVSNIGSGGHICDSRSKREQEVEGISRSGQLEGDPRSSGGPRETWGVT